MAETPETIHFVLAGILLLVKELLGEEHPLKPHSLLTREETISHTRFFNN